MIVKSDLKGGEYRMKNFFGKVKEKLAKAKGVVAAAVVGGVGSVLSITTHAAGTADTETVTSMTSAFENVKATGLAALGAIAIIGISLFAGIYAWKYGKKIFAIISK